MLHPYHELQMAIKLDSRLKTITAYTDSFERPCL